METNTEHSVIAIRELQYYESTDLIIVKHMLCSMMYLKRIHPVHTAEEKKNTHTMVIKRFVSTCTKLLALTCTRLLYQLESYVPSTVTMQMMCKL